MLTGQLIWYSRTCGSYQVSICRGMLLTKRLYYLSWSRVLSSGYVEVITSKFYFRLQYLVNRYGMYVCVTDDIECAAFVVLHNQVDFSFMIGIFGRSSATTSQLDRLVQGYFRTI